MERILRLFESKAWAIIRSLLFIALYSYLLTEFINRLPGTKSIVGICFWIFGIIIGAVDFVKAVEKAKSEK